LIVRGQDLYPSTLAQLDLARLLGKDTFAQTIFYHHPLLKSQDQKKLSKSAGSNSIQQLREEGKTLADLFLLLGKSLGIKEELRSFEEFNQSLELQKRSLRQRLKVDSQQTTAGRVQQIKTS
jgi:glutamyl-tRNA synthetase